MLSQYNVALFHLVNHAFFKALLFLARGAVIHGMRDQQDLRRLGGLVNFLPFTYTAILIGSLSLMAFPFLTGFYSKDLILEVALGQYKVSGVIRYWLGTISAVFTAFYSFRLISLTFFTVPNAPKNDYLHRHEAPIIIVIPLFILSIISIRFGYVRKDLYVGIGSDFLSTSLFQYPNHISLVEAEFGLPLILKLLPRLGSLFGARLAIYLYHRVPLYTIRLTFNKLGMTIYTFLNGKWLFDVVYNRYIISNGMILGHQISKVIDRGLIEIVGPFGFSNRLSSIGRTVANYDTGIITSYRLYIIIGLISFIYFLFESDMRLILIYLSRLVLLKQNSNNIQSL
jgi:NADH-ubiquinone oxidoreductase chain 5